MHTSYTIPQSSKIPVFAINLPSRTDRKHHILSQYADKDEFNLFLVEGESKFKTGSFNLWLTIRNIVKRAKRSDYDYFILCEDDHLFTSAYSFDLLQECIHNLQSFKPDLLLGGIIGFQTALKIGKNLYWIDRFAGLQFTIIFKRFYDCILNASFSYMQDAADYKLASLTSNKFVISPFISIQKEFGYSDVTQPNSIQGTVKKLFTNCERFFRLVNQIQTFYIENGYTLPDKRTCRLGVWGGKELANLLKEQADFPIIHEFSGENIGITVRDLKKIVRKAQSNDSDAILIQMQPSLHLPLRRTGHYICESFLEGLGRGAELIVSHTEIINITIPISNRFVWIDSFKNAAFILIYKNIFFDIEALPDLDEPVENSLSVNFVNKLALYPFLLTPTCLTSEDRSRLRTLRKKFNDSKLKFPSVADSRLPETKEKAL